MKEIKCITFNKAAQEALPENIKAKMKADREAAEKERHARYAEAFMYACPLSAGNSVEDADCLLSKRRIGKCTSNCGAIKDFINYLEKH